jgi:hypothetical protein
MEALQRLHMGGHPMPFGLHHPDQAMMRANIGEERKSPMNLETMSSTIINMVSKRRGLAAAEKNKLYRLG